MIADFLLSLAAVLGVIFLLGALTLFAFAPYVDH